jgi:pyruvate,water dikinase
LDLHSDVMIGQGDILSAEPARRICAMGALASAEPGVTERLSRGDISAIGATRELAEAFASYISRFGDRCVQELKLESRSLHEDPTPLLLAIAASARSGRLVHRSTRSGQPERLQQLFKGRPIKQALVGWLLRRARARVRDRENLRFERTRLFGRARRLFGALGVRLAEAGVLDDARDVFYLTIDEALAGAEGDAATALKRVAATRRDADARSLARPNPPERIQRGAAPAAAPLAQDALGETRRGLACCAGVVTARVRVIADPRVEVLAPGEILVASSTDPGWIAAFVNAAGIIAERGSLLSHSAIVAREMGVPCVVGLKGATEWLRTGDVVRLDGGAGVVERISP